MRKTLVVSDNHRLATFLHSLASEKGLLQLVDICCSPKAPPAVASLPFVRPVHLQTDLARIVAVYGLVISAHCKQIFPEALHTSVECVNIHPGFNPDTRGWFPQVWSIILGRTVGVTVHKIDRELDHGDIIYRAAVPCHIWDTSKSLYDRIIDAEVDWLRANITTLMAGQYVTTGMESDGTLFLKRDFDRLCEIDLAQQGSFLSFYNRLRALTFDGYRNAYFVDPATKKKVYLELRISHEDRS